MKDVLIYGGGSLGRQVHYLVQTHCHSTLHVVGFIDDVRQQGELVTGDLPVVGSLDSVCHLHEYAPDKVHLILAIGYSDMKGRGRAFHRAKAAGYEFSRIIHPGAVVEKNVHIGEGVIVMAGAVVDQFTTIQEANHLCIGTLIAENCHIGPNNFFAAGSTLGGNVTIGRDNFFGLDVTISNDVTVGDNNFVNAKTLLYKKLGDNRKVVELHENYAIGRS